MGNFLDKTWLFPFIGSIITLFSFLTPAAYFIYQSTSYNTEFFRWMLDFYISHVYDSGIHNYYMDINTDFTGYISFIISGLIIISNILVAINANRYKKQLSPSRVNWLIFSLFTLTLTICWMLMKEISTINSFHHSFWGLLTPGFGIIGIFLGVGLQIFGYILKKFKQRRIN